MDPVGGAMAGQAIRCVELAQTLLGHATVAVAAPSVRGVLPEGIESFVFSPHSPRALRKPIADSDLVFAPPQWPVVTRWLRRSPAQVIFDLYDPETFETLELFAGRPSWVKGLMVALTLDRLEDALDAGDRFVCASEKQRDLWLGALLRARAVNPTSYREDPSLRDMIDVIPSGVSALPARRSAPGAGMRTEIEALAEDDRVVLWNGGIWSWLDAPTAIRAIGLLASEQPNVRLVFMGSSSHVAAKAATRHARDLADQLGLLDRIVFFNERWVGYDQRADWLLEADCAVCTHRDHVEARFAWRTRILDCFWAGLPVVCTEGDELAERVAADRLGAAAPPEDPEALAAAIREVLELGRGHYREACAAATRAFEWPRLGELLRAWLDQTPPPTRRGTRWMPRSLPHRLRRAAYLAGGRQLMTLRSRGRA